MKKICTAAARILAVVLIAGCSGQKPDVETAGRNLVGHWKFDELTDNNTKTPDSSGNARHARIKGQVLVKGVSGSALRFGGYDQIVELGDLKLTAPATVAFWIKTNDLFRNRRLLSQKTGDANRAGALRIDGSRFEIWDGESWQTLLDRNLRIKEWMHIAVVFEEDGKTFGYLNGERQHLVRCGFDYDGVDAAVGAQFPEGEGNLFTGDMDDLRLYASSLAEEDIALLLSER